LNKSFKITSFTSLAVQM